MARRITTDSTRRLLRAVSVALCVAAFPAVANHTRVALGQTEAENPIDADEPVVVRETADDEETADLTSEERAAAIRRRAGEQVGDDPRGRAVVLGMHLQESDRGRATVVQVGPASPAFDAGVREGDEIVSFDGFSGKSYREWIDGMRKLARDTPEGEMMTVDMLRDGKRVSVRIRSPESRALEPRAPGALGQQATQEGAAGQVPTQGGPNQPIGPGVVSNDDVFVSGVPVFGHEFDDAMRGATERAMAEIQRLAEPPQTTQPATRQLGGVPPGTPSNRPAEGRQSPVPDVPGDATQRAARIGLAGFRDNPNGMLVMLDVGGLAPGSYRVSIDDPTLATGGPQPGDTGVSVPPRSQQPQSQQPRQTQPPQIQQPATQTPATQQPAVQQPGGVPRTPPTEPFDPSDGATQTGSRAASPDATATALPNADQSARQPTLSPQSPEQPNVGRASGQSAGATAGNAATLVEIGVLTVDQSGTGRLQQVVEGIHVRDVIGQAILIYAPVAPPETTVPPQANISDITGRRGAALNAGSAQGSANRQTGDRSSAADAGTNAAIGTVPSSSGNATQAAGTGKIADQANRPIAGGVIRLVSDRRPSGTAAATATNESARQRGAIERQDRRPRQRANRAQRAASQPAPEGQTQPR